MKSKNKPAQTAQEKRHIEKLAALPCVVCGNAGPVEIHEIKQGSWFTSVPLCADCHRGSFNGIHGQKRIWSVMKMDELKAINETLRMVLI